MLRVEDDSLLGTVHDRALGEVEGGDGVVDPWARPNYPQVMSWVMVPITSVVARDRTSPLI